jgi:hypothetical protein
MTLIELMVALAIGLFLTWGAIEVYVQSKSNYRASETLTRLQENARFALDTLEPDLRLAGFWGRHSDPARVTVAAGGIGVTCDGNDVTGWALDVARPVEASDDGYDLDCDPRSTARDGSDVLVIRHASETREAAPAAGPIQVVSNLARGWVIDDGILPADAGANPETRNLIVHAYYVDNESSFDDDIPSLRRKTLVNNRVIDEEMITGVENLQVQFGLDTNGDGRVERYVDSDDPDVPGENIAAVRIWLLVRSEDSPGPGFIDDRVYSPPDADGATITPAGPLYPERFQRVEVTKTVYLRNRAGG